MLLKKVFGHQQAKEKVPNKVKPHFILTKFGQIVFSLIQTKRQFLTLVKRPGITLLKQLLWTIKSDDLEKTGKICFSQTPFR